MQHYLSVVVVALLLITPLPLLSSSLSSSRQLAQRDRLDALKRLQVLLKTTKDDNDDNDMGGWRRTQRSDPPEWLGTHAAGTAWDAYVRMLRQQQLDQSEQPRRTLNPVNFLGKRAVLFN